MTQELSSLGGGAGSGGNRAILKRISSTLAEYSDPTHLNRTEVLLPVQRMKRVCSSRFTKMERVKGEGKESKCNFSFPLFHNVRINNAEALLHLAPPAQRAPRSVSPRSRTTEISQCKHLRSPSNLASHAADPPRRHPLSPLLPPTAPAPQSAPSPSLVFVIGRRNTPRTRLRCRNGPERSTSRCISRDQGQNDRIDAAGIEFQRLQRHWRCYRGAVDDDGIHEVSTISSRAI